MPIAYTQDKGTKWDDGAHHTSIAVTLTSTPTNGNTLVIWMVLENTGTDSSVTTPSGWTEQLDTGAGTTQHIYCATKVAGASESSTVTVDYTGTGTRAALIVFETPGAFGGIANVHGTGSGSLSIPTIDPDDGDDILIIAALAASNAYGITTAPSGYTHQEDQVPNDGGSNRLSIYSKAVNPASGTYSSSVTYAGGLASGHRVHMWFTGSPPAPVADFTADDFTVFEGESIQFTDLSTFTPTSWAWDFGDGGTSTSQHPSHQYTVLGTYTVSLTATNAEGSDTETKTAYITVQQLTSFDEPPPAGVLLEIYAAQPGSARWDQANWDEAEWSTAGWQDVTPEGIEVQATWGSRRPELGILHRPEAADWYVSFYDPARRLDPANADGPFFSDLEPGLPIRFSHRGVVVRTGYATGIQHSYADDLQNGFIRATDNLSRLANAQVPSDVDLGDTLVARAEAAIAAADLSIRVLPLATDPPLAAWVTGINEWSAWQWIMDAAEQVHHIPYIDRLGNLGFRPWASPLSRGMELNSPNLVDLQVISDYSGQYSVIEAMDDTGPPGTIQTRALTPPPRYGARTYTRNDPTINAGDWAQTVLEDRALPGLRWIPGVVFPLSAIDVEDFARIEAVEYASVAVTEQDPDVSATVIIVGGTIRIEGKRDSEATWTFEFEAAQTAVQPLQTQDGTEYLLTQAGDTFLYPQGA